MKIYLFAFLFLFAAGTASAASINVSPTSATLTVGSSFNVAVSVNPESDAIYTAKTSLSFPADMLAVESWSFGSGWSQLSQPGYDSVDNSGGALIKTAGYPGGLSSSASFGTVRFKVLKAGTANVLVTSASALYDEESQNALSSRGSGSFTLVSPAAPVPVVERTLAAPTPKATAAALKIEPDEDVATTSEEATSTPSVPTQTIVVNIEDDRDNTAFLLVISIFLAAIAGFISGNAYRRVRHHKAHHKK